MKELDLHVIKGNYMDVVRFFESDDCMELTESERERLFKLAFKYSKEILDNLPATIAQAMDNRPINWLYLSDYIKICGLFADAYVKDCD